MANYLSIFSASKEHIEFMRLNPGTSSNYCYGERPSISQNSSFTRFIAQLKAKIKPSAGTEKATVPADWPSEEVEVADIEINHRNVDLYHAILNKTLEPVEGVGSIFQTWFCNTHAAIPLDKDGEDFAFLPEQLPQLQSLVQSVTPESTLRAFQQWCISNHIEQETNEEERDALYADIIELNRYLDQAIKKKHGLVWIVS